MSFSPGPNGTAATVAPGVVATATWRCARTAGTSARLMSSAAVIVFISRTLRCCPIVWAAPPAAPDSKTHPPSRPHRRHLLLLYRRVLRASARALRAARLACDASSHPSALRLPGQPLRQPLRTTCPRPLRTGPPRPPFLPRLPLHHCCCDDDGGASSSASRAPSRPPAPRRLPQPPHPASVRTAPRRSPRKAAGHCPGDSAVCVATLHCPGQTAGDGPSAVRSQA